MQKYKIYNKIRKPISYSQFPFKRLLNFKRSKWKKLQKTILKRIRKFLKRKKFFLNKKKRAIYKSRKYYSNYAKNKKTNRFVFLRNAISLKKRFSFYEKVKQAYKEGLFSKYRFYQYFGSSMSLKYLKKQALLREKIFHEFLVKSFFKLDILLWKLQFFDSIKQAQQEIKNKNVLVNNISITSTNFFLKNGDVIKILHKNLKILRKKNLNTSFILSFCDVDFYTYKIILLKEYSLLTDQDFLLIFESLVGLRNFIYYLKKK